MGNWENTVGTLMKMLGTLDVQAKVRLQGCDCVGDWDGKIFLDERGGRLVSIRLERDFFKDGEEHPLV